MNAPRFTISILALNNLAFTKRCVESVLAHSDLTQTELIITDNGSTDGTSEYFASLPSSYRLPPTALRVTRNAANRGFIEPNREALALARGEFFLLLNNDCEVSPGWLEKLAAPFAQFPRAAITGPRSGCSALRPDWTGYRTDPTRRFEYIEGSCLCIKTRIAREHGLFSPDLEFAYGEDSDLCLRMRRLGYTLHLVDVKIAHHGGATRKQVPGLVAIEKRNHARLQSRFGHYLKFGCMDYPIIVKRKHAIGDVLLTTPILRALKQKFPVNPLHVQTMFPEIFARNPHVAGAAQRVQDRLMLRGHIISLESAYEDRPLTNVIDAYAIAAGLDPAAIPHRLEMFPDPSDHAWAAAQLDRLTVRLSDRPTEHRLCAIAAGPTLWPGKNWPLDRWHRVANELRSQGWRVVAIGVENGHALPCDLDLRGHTTRHQLAAVLARCAMFVGVDSFPMHCAQAMGCPTVGLFGCTSPEFLMTDSSPHVAVCADPSHRDAGARHKLKGVVTVVTTGAVMQTITVDQVLRGIDRLVSSGSQRSTLSAQLFSTPCSAATP